MVFLALGDSVRLSSYGGDVPQCIVTSSCWSNCPSAEASIKRQLPRKDAAMQCWGCRHAQGLLLRLWQRNMMPLATGGVCCLRICVTVLRRSMWRRSAEAQHNERWKCSGRDLQRSCRDESDLPLLRGEAARNWLIVEQIGTPLMGKAGRSRLWHWENLLFFTSGSATAG